MAAPPAPHSSLVRAAAIEDERVDRALRDLSHRRATLAAELGDLEAQMAALQERRRLLNMLVEGGDAAAVELPSPADETVERLRGRRLREVAARLLWTSGTADEVHYREWYERLVEAGYGVSGRDPLASFLTNIRDSPAVARGSRPGYYHLDPARLAAVRQEIAEAEAEMDDAEQSLRAARAAGDARRVEQVREHRDRLSATLRKLEGRHAELRAVFEADE